jgi:hypothetical protein
MGSVSPTPPELSPLGKELALAHFGHVEQQVGLATTKAGLIVTANSVLLAVYSAVAQTEKVFEKLPSSVPAWFFALAGAFLLLGLAIALVAARPKYRPENSQIATENALFFAAIAQRALENYLSDFERKDREHKLLLDLMQQTWAKSQWLVGMFRRTWIAMGCTLAGVLLGLAALVLDQLLR